MTNVCAIRPDFVIGTDDTGQDMSIDLTGLIAGRLLMMASSGGGKSWALRRLLEQTSALVQQIIIDPEGDFSSLAELCGHVVLTEKDLDEPYHMARQIRMHRVSVVLDISEFTDREHQASVVADFLSGLLEAPKEHWFPAVVAVDEAQLFAPFGDSELSEDTRKACVGAMTQLMCRGRKRGLAGVLATQRLAKVAKSVVSEVANVLIGRCLLDIDLARAGDLLGWNRRHASELRQLRPGQFYGFGPAVAPHPTMVTVGAVQSKHIGATPALLPPPMIGREAALQLLQGDAPAAQIATPGLAAAAPATGVLLTFPAQPKARTEADAGPSPDQIMKCGTLAPAMTKRNLWSDDEEARLKALFADQVADSELPAWFPGRTLAAIKYHANKLDLVRRKSKDAAAETTAAQAESTDLPRPTANPAPRRAPVRPACELASLDKIIDWLVSKRDIQVALKDGQYKVNGRIHTTEEELVRAANMHRLAYKLPLFALTAPAAPALQAAE